jgi:hypothetical protein
MPGAELNRWGCSSHGRAPALHAGGTGIDTLLLHTFFRPARFCFDCLAATSTTRATGKEMFRAGHRGWLSTLLALLLGR